MVTETTETAPAAGGAPAQKSVRTYWELVARDYVRNKLAMFGTLAILLVVTVAVFSPLIASQRPLYLKAVFAADYENSLFIMEEQHGILAGGVTGSEAQSAHDLFLQMLTDAEQFSGDNNVEKFTTLRTEFTALSPVSGTYDADKFAGLFDSIDELHELTLSPVVRYPAIRALIKTEIWFMLAYVAAVVVFFIRKRFKRVSSAAMAIAIPATIGLFLWTALYPSIEDKRPYRTIYEASGFKESGGEVIATLVPYGENENIISEARVPPTWWFGYEPQAGEHFHLLGTDTNGRDVLARMVYGARISMMIGILAVSIYTIIGVVLGALAGYFRGWVDIALSRIIEIVICFPVLMLILSVQAFLRPSVHNIIFAMAALWWTGVARLQRAEFLRLVGMDYVQAVRALGGSNIRIIFRHILPNALGPILVLVSFGIAGSILVESALSFLGFGVPQPMASWGDLLNNGRNDPKGTWWLTIFPGLAIFVTVTCFNLIGEGIRDALDPRRDH